ncbi:MAG TPA: phenylalanine-4-hydroxylase, partial [Bacteroidia bacterium]|nr:phenylalanine-4-hydroxylase [Bacteroidia bacterium]
MKTKRSTTQVYSNYTEQDFLVWKTLFNRQMDVLAPIVSTEYLKALEVVKFTPDKIPDFAEVNKLMSPITG